MKAEARGERHSVAVWEGKRAERVRLKLKKDDVDDRDLVRSVDRYIGRCVNASVCSAQRATVTSDELPT